MSDDIVYEIRNDVSTLRALLYFTTKLGLYSQHPSQRGVNYERVTGEHLPEVGSILHNSNQRIFGSSSVEVTKILKQGYLEEIFGEYKNIPIVFVRPAS